MMKQKQRYFILFLIFTLFTFSLSGCFNYANIDRLAYVVALGIDVGENNTLKVSFQISIPGGKSDSDQADSTIVNSVECASIDNGINLMNSYISKEINLSHCRVVVFSEEFAQTGISEAIYTLMNKVEIRPTANVIISRCQAEYFLNNSEPILEKLSARYYEVASSSSEYTGFTEDITLSKVFSDLNDTFEQCYTILGGVNTPNTHSTATFNPTSEKDASNKANETLLTSEPHIENMGLAVFDNDKLVGELNGIETICHQLINHSLDTCIITIPSPFEEKQTISLRLRQTKHTKNRVDFVNSFPHITTEVYVQARVLTMDQGTHYMDSQNIAKLEEAINRYLEKHLYQYLYKISKEFNSDIDGFGKYAASHFVTWDDWSRYNWLDNFQNSSFHVTVHSQANSGSIFINT